MIYYNDFHGVVVWIIRLFSESEGREWITGEVVYLYYFWNLFTYASQVPGGAAGDDLLRVLRMVGTCSLGAFCS